MPEQVAVAPALKVEAVTVRFGGLVAVNSVSLIAATGRMTGLIGPNGAGKSTLFNACTGLVKPSSGRVVLSGKDVTGLSPSARAQLGLGRTFQRMELFDRLSVAENVLIGGEARATGRRLLATLWQPPALRRELQERREEALTLCGLQGLRSRAAGALSTGQRRLVELARAIAGGFEVLLLDEPSSGLDHAETEEFGQVLSQVIETQGTSIVLVEHDMSLVTAYCHDIYVLEFGTLIAEGDAATVMASDAVKAAYLGTDAA